MTMLEHCCRDVTKHYAKRRVDALINVIAKFSEQNERFKIFYLAYIMMRLKLSIYLTFKQMNNQILNFDVQCDSISFVNVLRKVFTKKV